MTPGTPVVIVPKRVRWGRKRGQIDRKGGSPTIGLPILRQFQKDSGKHKNSGPSGKRANRFYLTRNIKPRVTLKSK